MTDRKCSVGGCERIVNSRGMCYAHYRRWWNANRHNLKRPTTEERFWSHVEKSATCWEWQAALDHGYGTFQCGTKANPVMVRAHRFSYELLVGPIPDGLQLDHLCMNKRCVNPEHLEPVTGAENTRRWAASRTHCWRGHEYNEENIRFDPNGKRVCKPCKKENDRQRHIAKNEGVRV